MLAHERADLTREPLAIDTADLDVLARVLQIGVPGFAP